MHCPRCLAEISPSQLAPSAGDTNAGAAAGTEISRLMKELDARDAELQEKNRALTEALEQQSATGEILRVISSSRTDLQPVLDALVKSAVTFCGADDAVIHRLEGDRLPVVAHYGPIPAPLGFVTPAVRGTTGGRCIMERRPIHVLDYQAESVEFPEGSAIAQELGYHTILSVPLLREGVPLGVIVLRRSEVQPFSDRQIALSRPSPIRPSSPSRTCDCSKRCGLARASCRSRSNIRPRRARSSPSSAAPRSILKGF